MKPVAQESKSFKVLLTAKHLRWYRAEKRWRRYNTLISYLIPIHFRKSEPKYFLKKMKFIYGAYIPLRGHIYINPNLDNQLPTTIVYVITHEFLHYWVHVNIGYRATFKLDKIGAREHFPMTETEPVLVPVRWGGRHHRSMWQLIWAFIAINTWKAKQELKEVMPVESGRRTLRRL